MAENELIRRAGNLMSFFIGSFFLNLVFINFLLFGIAAIASG
jgi:hypothetical protein